MKRSWLIGIVVALAAVGGVIYHARGATDSSPSAGARHRQMEVGEQNGGVAYGDTAKQVIAKVGSPTTKQGSCWSYRARAHTVNGECLGQFVDGLRYCFGAGPVSGSVVMAIYEHIVPHTVMTGKWFPGGWNHAMILMSPGQERLQV